MLIILLILKLIVVVDDLVVIDWCLKRLAKRRGRGDYAVAPATPAAYRGLEKLRAEAAEARVWEAGSHAKYPYIPLKSEGRSHSWCRNIVI